MHYYLLITFSICIDYKSPTYSYNDGDTYTYSYDAGYLNHVCSKLVEHKILGGGGGGYGGEHVKSKKVNRD